MKQFANVSCKYGAPMGRSNFGEPPETGIELFKIKLVDGDYDDGGAYWGGPANIYCAHADDYFATVRAESRWQAALALGLTTEMLTQPLDISADGLDEMIAGYLEAAVWADSEDGTNPRLPKSSHIKATFDCMAFADYNKVLVTQALLAPGYTAARLGHDFWLTRGRHGTGFWDRTELNGALGKQLTEAAQRFSEDRCYQYRGWFYLT